MTWPFGQEISNACTNITKTNKFMFFDDRWENRYNRSNRDIHAHRIFGKFKTDTRIPCREAANLLGLASLAGYWTPHRKME